MGHVARAPSPAAFDLSLAGCPILAAFFAARAGILTFRVAHASSFGGVGRVGILRLRLVFALGAQRPILAQDDKPFSQRQGPGVFAPLLA
jgi:hypothetical protein